MTPLTMEPTAAAAGTRDWIARAERVLAPTYRRPDRLFVSGLGCWLEDAEGRRYLDMTSGIAVTSLGHAAPEVVQALEQGAAGLVHTSNLYHTRPAVRLAELLVERSFADRVFFANSGAESVEGALKLALLRAGPERRTVIAFQGSFHGRTLGALGLTDRPADHATFRPPLAEFAPWNDPGMLPRIDAGTAAVIVEPLQGEGGVRVADDAWLRALRARCDEVGASLIFDEVQCGLGRTGRLWAHEWAGVTPDLLTLAKPLAGGLPMGAVLMTQAVADAITPGIHATTFGGGPLVASVAARVVERLSDPGLLAHVDEQGRRLRARLAELPQVVAVRGRGLLVGAQLELPAGEVVKAALEHGLLVVPARGDVVRFVPPLTVSAEELDQALERFQAALAEVGASR